MQETEVDETITTSLVTLIQKLLTFQGKTWYNTMLNNELSKQKRIMNCVRDGKDLFQVSNCNSQMVIALLTYMYKTLQGSILTKNLIKLFEQVIDFYEVGVYN